MKLILIGYVNKQNCRIWGTENLSRGTIRPFFFENEQGEAVTVNGDRYRAILNEFLITKIEEEDGATQSKLHSMVYALFLKIALSDVELMSFGHLGAAIWYRRTIICGGKISVTPASQRQLTL